jgi:hypothetical protein
MPLSANSVKINANRWRLAIVCFSLLSVVVLPLPALATNIQLQSDSDVATAGFYRLFWSMDNNAQMTEVEYQLQSSSDAQLSQAHIVYQGPDLARVVSGQSDGDYYYRIPAGAKP